MQILLENGLGVTSKKKSIFKDIIQTGGWVEKAFSKIFNELIFNKSLLFIIYNTGSFLMKNFKNVAKNQS